MADFKERIFINNNLNFFLTKWYEVSDFVLGRGSFSTVYMAYHSIFKNKVALKIINRNNIKEDYVLKNLRREASLLMKLNHPNIINFYEELSHRDVYCLSMEYVNGVNLSRYLKKQKESKVSENVARLFFYQMLSAVDHMHRLNILHRDLKHENVLVEFGRVIKIIDFGLSNVYQPTIQLRTHCGSFVYAAPELFETHSVYGAPIDLWSLGVILYSMVTGLMPFGVPKSAEDSVCDSKRVIFLQKISKGLTSKHRNLMRDLSFDCCNLLENLLKPNQFKRLRVKDALIHPWFENNDEFKSSLPQQRLDLKRKFKPEIIDYMATRMGVPRERIQSHILNFRYSKISAVFFIAQDTLMKQILYPPRNLERSFLYAFECWRKTMLGEDSLDDDESINGKPSSKGLGLDSSLAGESGFFYKVPQLENAKHCKKTSNHTRNVASIRKSAGDGCDMVKNTSPRQAATGDNQDSVKSDPPAPQQANDKSTEIDSYLKMQGEKGDGRLISNGSTANQPFRSYKMNRPQRFQAKIDRYNAEIITGTEKAAKDEKLIPKKRIPKVAFESPIDISQLEERFSTLCKIQTNSKSGDAPSGQYKYRAKPMKEIATRFCKTASSQQYPVKILSKRGTSELPQSRPATSGRTKDIFSDAICNGFKTHREQAAKESFLLEDSRQRFREISKDYAPVVAQKSIKVPASEFRYGNPSTFIQRPAFGTNNCKEYRNKARRFHTDTQVCKQIT